MHRLRRSMAFLVVLGPWLTAGQGATLGTGEPTPRLIPVYQSRKAPPVKLSRTAYLLEPLSDALRLLKPEEALRLAKSLPKGRRMRWPCCWLPGPTPARLTPPNGATAADLAEASPDKNTLALLRLVGVNLSSRNLRREHDLDEALALAKLNRQQVFLCLWAEWSKSSVTFKDEVLTNPDVKGAMRTLVPLSIQVEDEGEYPKTSGTQMAQRYRVRD